jgi:hypothetical protein
MPPRRAPRGEGAARRAAVEVVAAAAAEPAPGGRAAAGSGTNNASGRALPGPPRRRVFAAMAALHQSLRGASPADAAAEALGVDGLLAALLREAAAPPGPHARGAAQCLVAIAAATESGGGPARPDHLAAAADAALTAALRRDAACLFDAMGRVAAAQAAARSGGGAAPGGGGAAPGGSAPPRGGAGLDAAAAAAATPGLQLYALVHLACLLVRGCGPCDGAVVKAFARSGAAVDAALEVLLHGTLGFLDGGRERHGAANALALVGADLTGARHLRGAFPRVVPALVQRLERGAPGSTFEERSFVVHALQVRWGRTRQAGGRGSWDAGPRAATRWAPLLDSGRATRFC